MDCTTGTLCAIWTALQAHLCHMDRTTGTPCAIWTALQAKHKPSPTDEMFTEISKDFSICWNFPNCIESIDASTSEFTDRRTPAAGILTTNSSFPLFCRLLWTQILN